MAIQLPALIVFDPNNTTIHPGDDRPTVFSSAPVIPPRKRQSKDGYPILLPNDESRQNAFAVFYKPKSIEPRGTVYSNPLDQPVVGLYPLHNDQAKANNENATYREFTYKPNAKHGAALEDMFGLIYYLLVHNKNPFGGPALAKFREICTLFENMTRPIPLYPVLLQLQEANKPGMDYITVNKNFVFIRLQWGSTVKLVNSETGTNATSYNGFTLSFLTSITKHIINAAFTFVTGSSSGLYNINSDDATKLSEIQNIVNSIFYIEEQQHNLLRGVSLGSPPVEHIDDLPYDRRQRIYEKDMLDFVMHNDESVLKKYLSRGNSLVLFSMLSHKQDSSLALVVEAELVSYSRTVFRKGNTVVADRTIENVFTMYCNNHSSGVCLPLTTTSDLTLEELTIKATTHDGERMKLVATRKPDTNTFIIEKDKIELQVLTPSDDVVFIDMGMFEEKFLAKYTETYLVLPSKFSLGVAVTGSKPLMKGILIGSLTNKMSIYSKKRGSYIWRVYEMGGYITTNDKEQLKKEEVNIYAYNSAVTKLSIRSQEMHQFLRTSKQLLASDFRSKSVAIKRLSDRKLVPLSHMYNELRSSFK